MDSSYAFLVQLTPDLDVRNFRLGISESFEDSCFSNSVDGCLVFKSVKEAREFLIREYGKDMSSYVGELLGKKCQTYDYEEDSKREKPYYSPWLTCYRTTWINGGDFADHKTIGEVLENLTEDYISEMYDRENGFYLSGGY